MLVSDFDYALPAELIAQEPLAGRDASRMLVLNRDTGRIEHRMIQDLPGFLTPGATIVLNNTRVIPARLLGRRMPTGGAVECLLLTRVTPDRWDALMHPGHKLRVGEKVVFDRGGRRLYGEVLERHFFGRRVVRLWTDDGDDIDACIDAIGEVPLPPYIHRPADAADRERYQTVFGRINGSVAAPTAGLHFSEALLEAIDRRGIARAEITLHVGYGTFKPVRAERVEEHELDPEVYQIEAEAAAALNRSLDAHRPIVAVGTTTVRTLEFAVRAGRGRFEAETSSTSLFIYPGFPFEVTSGLLTNFHLPRSSLLMLVAAFAGRERVMAAYREAIELGYRFYSYGDAMLIL